MAAAPFIVPPSMSGNPSPQMDWPAVDSGAVGAPLRSPPMLK
jgi:hypothetical protein